MILFLIGFGTDFGGPTETRTLVPLGFKPLGRGVANSPGLHVCIERREDANNSPKATRGHVTLAPVVFVSFSFSSYLQTSSNARCCDKPLAHIFSLKPCV